MPAVTSRTSCLGLAFGLACLSGGVAALRSIPLEGRRVQGGAPTLVSATKASSGVQLLPWDAAWAEASETIPQLTLQELYGLVRGVHFSILSGGPDEGYYTGNTLPVPRLGVPALKMQDASQGFRVAPPNLDGTSTSWPCMLALAATWDETAVASMAQAVAREFKGKGANVLLGPGLNVNRVARNGRNFEYLSGEDPYLGGRLAAAHVEALQGEGVMAVAKHFAFNEQETNRMTETSNVDARTAWELYYPPFQAAVDAGVTAIMCAYNQVNGTYSSENPGMLVRDLQTGMGFRGPVMSDWGAVHRTQAIQNGLSMDMPGIIDVNGLSFGLFTDEMLEQVPPAAVSAAAQRVLAGIFHMRLHENPGCSPPCRAELATNQTSPEHRELAHVLAAKSITLLKNDGNVLPITSGAVRSIALLGEASNAANLPAPIADYYAGGGSGKVGGNSVTTPLQGLRRRAATEGITVLHGANTVDEAVQLAQAVDLVIVVGATTSSEGIDRDNLSLDGKVDELIAAVAPVKRTVVLMQTPGAVLTPWRNQVPAIAQVFLAGEETGSAWASVLFGDIEPSGRLPILMPETEADAISPASGDRVDYSEGLLTSYRNPNFKAAFPFGHGLSYTNFSYGHPEELSAHDCPTAACVRVRVTNTGARHGTEVVQAYLHYPSDASQPHRVLKGFVRTSHMVPGASEEVTLEFTARDLSVYSPTDGWTRVADLEAHIGSSSQEIRHVLALARPAQAAA